MTRFSAGLKSSSPLLKQGDPTEPVEGDGLQAVRYHCKTITALAAEGGFLFRKTVPQGLKPIEIVRVMYELKLVPFIPFLGTSGFGGCDGVVGVDQFVGAGEFE